MSKISIFSFVVGRLGVALRTAAESLSRNPLRAGLTGFGILVGVAAVTVVMTLGEGAERAVQERIEKIGENLLTIRAESAQASGASNADRPTLIEADARAIAEHVDGVAHVAPILDSMVRVIAGSRNTSVQAIGTTSAYLGARNYEVDAGTIWSPSHEATAARVVLLGPKVVQELFSGEEPVGQSIRIGRHLFRVIGLLSEKGQTPFGMDQDNIIVMPLKTMRSKIVPGRPGEVRQIVLATKDGVMIDKIKRPITALLRQRHHIEPGDGDDFSLRDQSRMAEAQRGVVDVMRMLLLSIAGVSLIIGGIGVMNIMLVSVTERSREIGTRLAVGARGADILIQFLIEAVVLSLLGGAAGAALAALLVAPLEEYFGWEMFVSPRALSIATAVSLTIGVVFGLLPARRAARLDPVEALRRE
jgi:putative ABC transport system permease protein